MGRWSEPSAMWVDQVASKARWLEAKETSGDEGLPPVGSRVGEFSLRTQKLLSAIWSAMESPLDAALASAVCENQRSLWALKSPTTNASEEQKSRIG